MYRGTFDSEDGSLMTGAGVSARSATTERGDVEFWLANATRVEFPGQDFPTLDGIRGMDCWAVATTLLKSWDEATPYSIEEVVQMAGGYFYDLWASNHAAQEHDMLAFTRLFGIENEPAKGYTPADYANMLRDYGPLAVVLVPNIQVAPNLYHAVVITGVTVGDSPATSEFRAIDTSTGLAGNLPFPSFQDKFEVLIDHSARIFHFGLGRGKGRYIEYNTEYGFGRMSGQTTTIDVEQTAGHSVIHSTSPGPVHDHSIKVLVDGNRVELHILDSHTFGGEPWVFLGRAER